MSVAAIARFKIKPGQGQAFESVFDALAKAVRQEPGSRYFHFLRCRDVVDTYIVVEIYASDAALAAHASYPHTKEGGPRVMELLVEDPSVEFCDVVC